MSFKKIALFILLAVSPIITKLVYVYATGNPVRGWSQMGIWYAAFFFRCEILSSFSEVIEVARSEGGVDHEKSIGKGVGIRCFLSCGQPHHLLFHELLEGWLGAYWNHGRHVLCLSTLAL